jgi:hypothetical protein
MSALDAKTSANSNERGAMIRIKNVATAEPDSTVTIIEKAVR